MHPVQKEKMEKHPSFHSVRLPQRCPVQQMEHTPACVCTHTLVLTHNGQENLCLPPGRKLSQLLLPSQQETGSMAQGCSAVRIPALLSRC